jgi:hypothetical protein
MSVNNSCSLGYPQCRTEIAISLPQVNQAYKMAERFSLKNAPFGIPMYPFVFTPTVTHDTIRMEMGRDETGKHIVALFTMKQVPDRPGALVHIAVFLLDDKIVEKIGIDPGFAATFSIDIHYHVEAVKHFRGQLLHMVVPADVSNNYIVNVPDLPPPPEEELPPPPDFEETL